MSADRTLDTFTAHVSARWALVDQRLDRAEARLTAAESQLSKLRGQFNDCAATLVRREDLP